MLSKKISNTVLKLFGTVVSEDAQDSKDFLSKMIHSCTSRIMIVTGELNKNFYDYKLGVDIAKRIIDKNVDTQIVFAKADRDINEKQDAISVLLEENKGFVKALLELDSSHKSRVRFYFSSKRPSNHFAVIDNSTYVESYHKPNKPRTVFVRQEIEPWARRYVIKFSDLIKSEDPKVEKITLSEIEAVVEPKGD